MYVIRDLWELHQARGFTDLGNGPGRKDLGIPSHLSLTTHGLSDGGQT